MNELEGRVAIVTGSSSGIGEATARRLSALGANVVVNSASSVTAGEAVAASLPTEAAYVRVCIPRKASLDLIYQRNRSICLDLWLIGKTMAKIVGR